MKLLVFADLSAEGRSGWGHPSSPANSPSPRAGWLWSWALAGLCHQKMPVYTLSQPKIHQPCRLWAVYVMYITTSWCLHFRRGLFPAARCQGPRCLRACYREDDSLNRAYRCVFNQGLWGLIKMSPSCFVCSLKRYSSVGLCCIMLFCVLFLFFPFLHRF